MSVSASFLVEKRGYSLDRFLSSIVVAAFRANTRIHIGRCKRYNRKGNFDYFQINLSYRLFHNSEVIVYVDPEKEVIQSSGYYTELLKGMPNIRLKPGVEYCKAGGIDNILDTFYIRGRLLYDFVYEYLKQNPEDLFWVEDDWVYGLEEMEQLRRKPYNPAWFESNPNQM